MSYGETIEDLNTLVGKLTNRMTDTFKSCTRNYEALLPYFGKKETKSKIHHKLLQVNMLLNMLNEELLHLRVVLGCRIEYVTDSSYEQKEETVLSEGGRKRRMSDVIESDRHETKSIKMEAPFSINTECSTALTSETVINIQSENLALKDSEDTRHTQVQKSDMEEKENIKTVLRDSNEVEDIHKFPISNAQIPAVQKSCDTTNNGMTVCFAGNEVSASVADSVVGGNTYDKSDDTITQREDNEECVLLENAESETSNQEEFEDSGNVLSKDHDIYRGLQEVVPCMTSAYYQAKRPLESKESTDAFTTCDTEFMLVEGRENSCNEGGRGAPHSHVSYEKGDVPIQISKELCNAEDKLYGVIRRQTGRYRCTLCSRELFDYKGVNGHVKGKRHKKKVRLAKKNNCANESEVLSINYKSELVNYQAVHGNVKGKKHKNKGKIAKENSCAKKSKASNNRCENTASVSVCSVVTCSLADTVPSNSCDITDSVSVCSAVSCSLADTVAIVEARFQVISMKHAMKLDDIWTYFHAPFHINKKFFRFHSGQIICSLCYEEVGRYILSIRKHISRLSHLDRIKILRSIELENKSSNKELFDIPSSLKNIVPTSQFSLSNSGFFCNLCNCFLENTIVLNHMTGESHGKKLDEVRKSVWR